MEPTATTTLTTNDIYEQVTRQIIAAIEAGTGTWQMPWHVTGADVFSPMNVSSRRPYRGVNVLCLWAAAQRAQYTSGTWGTYRQWQERGARVRKGERATQIVFWRIGERPTSKREGEETTRPRSTRFVLAQGYSVFNADQVDGYVPPPTPKLSEGDRIAAADAFLHHLGADISPGCDRAFYSSTCDFIALPRFEDFREPTGYYSVLAHEIVHWTGAKHRLGRDLAGRFGSRTYAAEELVAELGSAFLCSGLGLRLSPRSDHAAYIDSWLELLRDDKRAIFTAASRAQQAVDYLLTLYQAATRDAA